MTKNLQFSVSITIFYKILAFHAGIWYNKYNRRKDTEAFVSFWKDKGYEKGESQAFWLSLLRDVYGLEHPEQYISFEDQVKLDHASFIDGYIEKTHVMIKQKSLGKDLRKEIPQSDGSFLSPFQQAKRYAAELPYSRRPRRIITCNFAEFLVYDMEKPNGEPEQIFLKNLRMNFIVCNFWLTKKIMILKKNGKFLLMREKLQKSFMKHCFLSIKTQIRLTV